MKTTKVLMSMSIHQNQTNPNTALEEKQVSMYKKLILMDSKVLLNCSLTVKKVMPYL